MISMNAFEAEPEELRLRELAALERVVRSGRYVLGREVLAFEEAWAAACGVAHAVGVGNGMDAIELGLRARNLGVGDEIITTPMTAFATTLAILRAGATPVFADIDAETALLDPASVERCITPRTRAVLLVHLYGRMHDLERWTTLCAEHRLLLLEDCAQAHAARWAGRPAGSWGSWGAFSFYPTKNLGALGDGGMLVTDDEPTARRARILRNYGQTERYHHPELGLNSRLDELQAALLGERLAWLPRFNERRRDHASRLRAGLRNPLVRPLSAPPQSASHVHHLFVVRCARRDDFAAFLAARGIETLIHYPIPIHHQAPCVGFARDPRGLAAAEAHAAECLSLPCHPQLSDDELRCVTDAVNDFR